MTEKYELQNDSYQRQGRRVSMQTWSDISPERYLMLRLEMKVIALSNNVPETPAVLPSTWRKRLAHVTEK